MSTVKTDTSNAALLFHAMYVMAAIDGNTSVPELAVVRALITSLPEFADTSVAKLVSASRALAKAAGGTVESVDAIIRIKPKAQRTKCFLMAAEVAYASGGIGKAEAALLRTMAKILQLDTETTRPIIKVLGLKYV